MTKPTKLYLTAVFAGLLLSLPMAAQTGGTFDLSHSVIASGGGASTGSSGGPTFTVE